MCGITGKYNFATNESVDPALIHAMNEKIWYRGPDDHGVFTDGCVGMGHRRLSILDLSENGHQPMSTSDGNIWITYNGEIYNFKELQKELIQKGCQFKSNCDTEVILYSYKEYGINCLQHLRGMFAFAIWDKQKEILFLARDRIGKKPLFYYDNGKSFIFASEIKSILEDFVVKKEINYQAFYDYFKYLYVPAPKTIYNNIYKLNPGHYLICSKHGIKVEEYWDVSFANPIQKTESEISEELYNILNKSVKLRMISDVPLGAFLSGGIDSSSVVAFMANNCNGKPVTTCSIGFDSEQYDEITFARQVSQKFDTDHHEFTVKEKAKEVLQKLVYHFDEPFADSSSIPTYFVSKLAKQRVTVALSGDGGDENFAGYEKYYFDDIENRIRRKLPKSFRSLIFPSFAQLLSNRRQQFLQRSSSLLNSLSFEPDYGFYLTNTEMKDSMWSELINDETRGQIGDYDPFSVTENYYHKADTDNHLAKILYTDLKTYLPGDILTKVDRTSMANSLEVRAPILDHNVIEFAASIPVNLKYNRGDKKYILKQTIKNLLPPTVLYRKKMGFSVPLADWFRGEINDLADKSLFSENAGVSNFFHQNKIKEIWDQHQTKKRNHAAVLWSLLMFELWFQEFME